MNGKNVMREILFKGKTDKGEWKYGMPCATEQSGIYALQTLQGGIFDIIPESIGQYTGLKDKNNTKIFEGDIVTCQTKYGADVGQIIFAMGKFCVWWHSEYHYPNCAKMITCYDINSKTKVIGNIIDNPELLRGKVI